MIKTILVTGGAGYIGSHTVKELLKKGYKVVVLDDLSKGRKEFIEKGALFVKGTLEDKLIIDKVFNDHAIDAVMHFSADSLVGESVENPSKYFKNNIINGIQLLDAMIKHDIKLFVFSSSAAVYGEPSKIPIFEEDITETTNPYGLTKFIFEEIMKSYDSAYGFKFISLRYFNAAGADISGEIGEAHNPETHLIPIVLQVALDQRKEVQIFGEDYSTKDGTCVRDYIHVTDLANAHILAIEALLNGKDSSIYNLGNGEGYSVKEVINIAREVTEKEIPSVNVGRRKGDPAVLIASSDKIIKELKWKPKFADLKLIIRTAWKWHQKNPKGF